MKIGAKRFKIILVILIAFACVLVGYTITLFVNTRKISSQDNASIPTSISSVSVKFNSQNVTDNILINSETNTSSICAFNASGVSYNFIARVTMVANFYDSENNLIPESTSSGWFTPTIDTTSSWTKTDNVYYYNSIVSVGNSTNDITIFNGFSLSSSMVTGSTLNLYVYAEIVQATPYGVSMFGCTNIWGI
jgi:hypothetical protein